MKLVMCIVHPEDVGPLSDASVEQGHRVTRMGSVGGFLRRGNVTLFIGAEDEEVEEVLTTIKKTCHPHIETLPEMLRRPGFTTHSIGAAVVFVFDMEQYERLGPVVPLDNPPPAGNEEDG